MEYGDSGTMVNSSLPSSDLNDVNNLSSSSSISIHQNHNHNSDDPMQSWWESVSKGRSRIQSLLSLLPSIHSSQGEDDDESSLSALADSDRPARSLLESAAAYSAISAVLSSPLSGSGDDPLCHWLYDTYQSADADLKLVVLSFVPLLSGLYLSRLHASSSLDVSSPSLAGFEAVLLALYASETKSRAGKPLLVSIPDLSQPSLYHTPTSPSVRHPSSEHRQLVGVLSPPLEPQLAIKSTKRGCIIGVALQCYYSHISHMPNWSKIELCRFAASWAGDDCSCAHSLETDFSNNAIEDIDSDSSTGENIVGVHHMTEGLGRMEISSSTGGAVKALTRTPLPWELLQPVLRIIGHCLLAPPINVVKGRENQQQQELRDWASMAVRRLFARASHDLNPQGILATRSLIRLDNRSRAASRMASSLTVAISTSSNGNTPKKPEILLVSK